MADSKTVKTILLPPRVDDEAAIFLKSTLIKHINDGAKKIICNFSATEFISEEAINELGNVAGFLNKNRGELGICLIKPEVKATIAKPHLFKFYSMEESVALVALRNLVNCFDQYEDILDLKVRMENAAAHIEIHLVFDANQTMCQVQNTVDLIRHNLEQEIKNAQVLIVPSAQIAAITPAQPVLQKNQIVFSSQAEPVRQLAQAIRQTIPEDISCISIKDISADDSCDLISVVCLVSQATVDSETASYLQKLQNQHLALFAVTESYPYSGYAGECMKNITALLDISNTVVGKYICQTTANQVSEKDLMRARNKYFDIIQKSTEIN